MTTFGYLLPSYSFRANKYRYRRLMTSTEVVNSKLKGSQETYQYTVWEDTKQAAHMVTATLNRADNSYGSQYFVSVIN